MTEQVTARQINTMNCRETLILKIKAKLKGSKRVSSLATTRKMIAGAMKLVNLPIKQSITGRFRWKLLKVKKGGGRIARNRLQWRTVLWRDHWVKKWREKSQYWRYSHQDTHVWKTKTRKHEAIKLSTCFKIDNRSNLISRKPQAVTARTGYQQRTSSPNRWQLLKNVPSICSKNFSAPRGKDILTFPIACVAELILIRHQRKVGKIIISEPKV